MRTVERGMRILSVLCAASLALSTFAQPASFPPSAAAALKQPDTFFPLAVWLQSPRNVGRYQDIGVNLYVGLWRGPTEEQLAALKKAGMPVICHANDVARNSANRDVILAYMHGDEPDNAQSLGQGRGYGPPILPAKIVEDYRKIHASNPEKKPVFLNLGQGVAWDNWIGRGVRRNKPEDYPEYLKGCDIASFDIYPAVHDNAEVAGNLWYVARGVERLRQWSGNGKPVFACIETTRISNENRKPTPYEVRAEVWMAIVHGASGIVYFAHEFKPRDNEAGLLADAEMSKAVGEINEQIEELAPVLNSRTSVQGFKLSDTDPEAPVATLTRRHGNATYVFAVAMRNKETTATFTVPGLKGIKAVEALGEPRVVAARDGVWTDTFKGYEVHLYKLEH